MPKKTFTALPRRDIQVPNAAHPFMTPLIIWKNQMISAVFIVTVPFVANIARKNGFTYFKSTEETFHHNLPALSGPIFHAILNPYKSRRRRENARRTVLTRAFADKWEDGFF